GRGIEADHRPVLVFRLVETAPTIVEVLLVGEAVPAVGASAHRHGHVVLGGDVVDVDVDGPPGQGAVGIVVGLVGPVQGDELVDRALDAGDRPLDMVGD